MKSLLTKKFISQIKTVFWITVAWTIISVYQFYVGYDTLIYFEHDFGGFDPMIFLKQSLIVGILAGLIGGSGIVFLWERWLRSWPYGRALISIFLSYVVIYLVVAIPTNLFFQSSVLNGSIFAAEVWKASLSTVFESDSIFGFVTWLIILLCTMIEQKPATFQPMVSANGQRPPLPPGDSAGPGPPRRDDPPVDPAHPRRRRCGPDAALE